MKSLLIFFMLLFSFQVIAQGESNLNGMSASYFVKRFELVKKDGKLVEVRDRTRLRFSVKKYVKFIKGFLKKNQAQSLIGKNDLYEDIERFLLEVDDLNAKNNEYFIQALDGLEVMNEVDIDAIFGEKKFQKIMEKLKSKVKHYYSYLDPRVLARPNEDNYFFKRNALKKIFNEVYSYAKKYYADSLGGPYLKFTLKVVENYLNSYVDRRSFQQNALIHYLENFTPEELGMSSKEVNLVFSSIFESRLGTLDMIGSRKAKKNWDSYGTDQFYSIVRDANYNFKKNRSLYTPIKKSHINSYFKKVKYKNKRKLIVNILDRKNSFSKKPSVAYDYREPYKIPAIRAALWTAEMGLSFLPNNKVKSKVRDFISSAYRSQRVTEGALFGYFESKGEIGLRNHIITQYGGLFDPSL